MSKIRLLNCLKPGASRIALIFLHHELTAEEVYAHRTKYDALWTNAIFTCAAGKGCDFLYEHFRKGSADEMVTGCPWIPNLITGDFDSAGQGIPDFYRAFPGVRIESTTDKCNTTFSKALELVAQEITSKNLQVDMIVAVCSGKGRLDRKMGIINTLFQATSMTDVPVVLMSERDVQYVVPKGTPTTLLLDTGFEGVHCGLLPVAGPSKVTTTGLRWNVAEEEMQFGGLISTSNEMTSPSVTVQSSMPILWTMSVRDLDVRAA